MAGPTATKSVVARRGLECVKRHLSEDYSEYLISTDNYTTKTPYLSTADYFVPCHFFRQLNHLYSVITRYMRFLFVRKQKRQLLLPQGLNFKK